MPSINLSQNVMPMSDVLVQNLADEAVLLNLESEAYFGLDAIGTRIFTLLQEKDSIAAVHQQLLQEYDVDSERLQQDLLSLIEQLVEHGLVQVI
ncbi:MAG: PqqD family protein [Jaaginema sp. PMC 1079.18]|nr:PqqD family protein [Jaaginema sp. PMC 1080.18]MEC4853152.1 PqqD family protein [Jaaginema sp. PMC 1079.18]MEC4864660.1 PqqD family protein [Jaaginema sp. PMC 1078.18]